MIQSLPIAKRDPKILHGTGRWHRAAMTEGSDTALLNLSALRRVSNGPSAPKWGHLPVPGRIWSDHLPPHRQLRRNRLPEHQHGHPSRLRVNQPFFLSREDAKKVCPSVSASHCHLPQQAVGGLAVGGFSVVSAEPKILPELVSGRWQPEGLTEGNVV